jgi:hypothetical protein
MSFRDWTTAGVMVLTAMHSATGVVHAGTILRGGPSTSTMQILHAP